MLKYTEGPVRADTDGGFLFANSKGGCRNEESDFILAQIRGWGHLKYLGGAEPVEIQDGNLKRLAAAWNAVQGIPTEEIQPMVDENRRLRAALQEILDLNPKPTLPYGHQVNEIATKALKGE